MITIMIVALGVAMMVAWPMWVRLQNVARELDRSDALVRELLASHRAFVDQAEQYHNGQEAEIAWLRSKLHLFGVRPSATRKAVN